MHTNFITKNYVNLLSSTTAAGTTTITSSAIDCAGFQSVTGLVALGTVTATGTGAVTLTECATSGGTYTEVTGSSATWADTDGSKVILVENVAISKRYVKVVAARATANTVLGSVMLICSNPRKSTTQPTTVLSTTLVNG